MKFIGEYKELCPNHDYPSLKEFLNKNRYEHQEVIVQYLRNGEAFLAAAGKAKDVFTGEDIPGELLGMRDEEYTWFNILAFYVDKYNLRLPKDFEEHILSKMSY